jgi:membrane associated rhomboid family serine protease
MMQITNTVKQLLIINVIVFIGANSIAPAANDLLAMHFPMSDQFYVWQLFTHMFMHANIQHIFFNMFGLFMFGSVLEQLWGSQKFLFFYISCGLGAVLIHSGIQYYEFQKLMDLISQYQLSSKDIKQMMNVTFNDNTAYYSNYLINEIRPILEASGKTAILSDPEAIRVIFEAAIMVQTKTVGASGAIYGLLFAFAFMFPNMPMMLMFIPIPIKAKFLVGATLLYDFYAGITGSSIFGAGGNIAHFAHLGGAFTGFVMMWYWKKSQFNKNRWN